MNYPLISVIVPIYGIERYVGHCIESLMQQTCQNLEIILVDDGSSDRCPQICDLYASKDKRIKVIHKENGGIVTARKAGVQIAQRCGGITSIANDKVLNCIYNRSIEGKKVVIGGDGTFGQQMYRRLVTTGKVEITGWIDPFYWEYRRIGMNVDPVESITNAEYDYVLMAGLDSSFKETVIRTLADYGVDPDKVLPVEMNYGVRHEILMDYLKCEEGNA